MIHFAEATRALGRIIGEILGAEIAAEDDTWMLRCINADAYTFTARWRLDGLEVERCARDPGEFGTVLANAIEQIARRVSTGELRERDRTIKHLEARVAKLAAENAELARYRTAWELNHKG